MLLQALSFYAFASVLVLSALMVISAKNPVHSVLFLILGFFNAAGLFVLLGAEFVAMILVIVYVGAVAVLFLFVVMMLDINFSALRQGAMQYLPLGLGVGGVLLVELFLLFNSWSFAPTAVENGSMLADDGNNVKAIGRVIYTDYAYVFQVSGLILLVAMIGAIVLTHRRRPDVLRQNVADQVARKQSEAMEVVKVESGKGIGG